MNKTTLQSGRHPTTRIGFINSNRQQCQGTLSVGGTDHLQYAYRLECLDCGYVYGANGSDVAIRKCPECQGGMPGIRYWFDKGNRE